MDKVIVSQDSFSSKQPEDIIYSNISFINILQEEGFEGDFCHEAKISYYIDYYLTQTNNGGFSQFIYNSGCNDELITLLLEGLEKIQALNHLAFFQKQVDFINNFDEVELAKFLNGDYFGKNPTRDALNNDEFFTIKENLITLNANWLRSLPNLCILSIDQMFEEAEKLLGKKINKTNT